MKLSIALLVIALVASTYARPLQVSEKAVGRSGAEVKDIDD